MQYQFVLLTIRVQSILNQICNDFSSVFWHPSNENIIYSFIASLNRVLHFIEVQKVVHDFSNEGDFSVILPRRIALLLIERFEAYGIGINAFSVVGQVMQIFEIAKDSVEPRTLF